MTVCERYLQLSHLICVQTFLFIIWAGSINLILSLIHFEPAFDLFPKDKKTFLKSEKDRKKREKDQERQREREMDKDRERERDKRANEREIC